MPTLCRAARTFSVAAAVGILPLLAAAPAQVLFASAAVAQQAAPAVTVTVAAAWSEALTDESRYIGQARALDEVQIVPRVSGFLDEVLVRDGAEVAQGEMMFHIESDAYQAAVDARRAELAAAVANKELATIELGRRQELLRRGTTPQREVDIARANEAVAVATVDGARAALRAAELNLSYTSIAAPFAGRIGTVNRSVGDLVSPSTPPLVRLVRERPMRVSFSLSERELVRVLEVLHADNPAELTDPQLTPEVFLNLPNGRMLDEPGQIVFIDNRIDPTTGTITLMAEFPNTDRLIVDGAFLDVRIRSVEPVERLLIPQAAVQRDQRGDFVLIVTPDGRVEQRYVTLGRQNGAAVIVADGMREGETVIVEGLQRVRPGVEVQTVLAGRSEE